ncbi:MAG: ABC transporter substrate-binding protein [Chloroflexota bacterium]|nr:ABC transporter substrate-binding protein [Chloroflexota bacterium]
MKKVSVLLSFALVCVLLTALAIVPTTAFTQDNPTPTPLPTLTLVPPVPQPEGSIKITFWYGLGGLLGNVVQETVNQYNLSQTTYYVEAIFQSSYDDTINKINAGLASGDLPDVVQIFEAGTQRMIDTGRIVPVQSLLERDGMLGLLDELEPAVRANYTVGGTLYSMPFNSSTAMLYINRAAFVEAGLDPDKTIWTYEEILEAARQLTVTDANGEVSRYGLAVYPESWFFEQIHAVHDQLFGTPANGRGDTRMDAYAFNGEVGVNYFNFLNSAITEGTALYYGTGGGAAAGSDFATGRVAMHFSSIASLRTLIASAERAGAGVDVGVVMMPRQPDAAGRTIVGGASLWMTNVGSPEVQEGAWDFLKWSVTPEVQAVWAANTGYYPVVTTAYDQPAMQEALVQFPQFQVAIDSIRMAPVSDANSAHVSGVFVSMRTDVITAMDDFFTGRVPTAQEALDNAVALANEKLEEYNSTVP